MNPLTSNRDKKMRRATEKNWPKISIITPSYNQGEFLERTILSVIEQNYPNLEYIIIDGGSTDGSVDIIQKYADKLAYWISEKDNGQTHAINKGFKKATGEIVAWLNSDDEFCEGALMAVASVFMEHDEVDFVFGNQYSINSNGKIIRDNRHTRFSFAALWAVGMVLSQPSCFWKCDFFSKFGYLDETMEFCMDYEFFLRIGNHVKAKHVNQYLSKFRWHESQKSSTIIHIRDSERQLLKERYHEQACRNYPVWLVIVYVFLFRSFWYIMQGDFFYVVRGLIRRLLPQGLRPRRL